METIFNYLENMFLQLPQTPEVLRAKQELGNMMEDKFQELIAEGRKENEAVGIVISEFGNLEELAEELGISQVVNHQNVERDTSRYVDREEAETFIEMSRRTSIWVSFGVMLCILSPCALIYIGTLQDYSKNGISDGMIVLFGLIPLLLLVAIAVVMFCWNGMKMEKYEYMKKENFQMDAAFKEGLKQRQEQEKPKATLKLIIGILLCIFSVMPFLVVGAMFDDDLYAAYALIFLLVMVSVSIWFFIAGGSTVNSLKILLQEEEFSKEGKKSQKLMDVIGGIYWPIATVIYLGWSFWTMDWGFTWIVWPIAGILYGVIASICNIVQKSVSQ